MRGGPMTKCPVCDKTQLVIVADPIETSCSSCGAHWVQEGSEQRDVKPADPPTPAPQSTWRAFNRKHANV